MHGAGNDFVVVDGRTEQHDWAHLAVELCDRHFGVGADGLLIVSPSSRAQVAMRMFNPDGSEAEMCGNGIRAFAKWVVEDGAIAPVDDVLAVETKAGVRECRVLRESGLVRRVRVSMGRPLFEATEIGVAVESPAPIKDVPLVLPAGEIKVTCVSMGNPHAVQFIESDPAEYPLESIGPRVEHHPIFPNRVNFHVVRVLDRATLEMRTWERGAGLTLACGTGICAAVVAASIHGLVDGSVDVRAPGGTVHVDWDGRGEVLMTGPASRVFTGETTNN